MNGDVNIQINKDLIIPIIQSKIKGAMVEALGEEKNLIETVVDHILNLKVDEDGKVSNYSSSNQYKWIDIVLKKSIEETAREVFKEYLDENRDKIKLEIHKQLRTRKGLAGFVNKLFDGVAEAVDSNWKFSAHFKFKED